MDKLPLFKFIFNYLLLGQKLLVLVYYDNLIQILLVLSCFLPPVRLVWGKLPRSPLGNRGSAYLPSFLHLHFLWRWVTPLFGNAFMFKTLCRGSVMSILVLGAYCCQQRAQAQQELEQLCDWKYLDKLAYHPWKWFQPITDQITVMIFHEIATVSWFQTKSPTVWFFSWKSLLQRKSKEEKAKWQAHPLQNFCRNFWRSLQSAGNSSVRAFTHEWSF